MVSQYTLTYNTVFLVNTLSLIKFSIQRANTQYFHRVEQSQLYHTVSWNFYNNYKQISKHRTAWCYESDTSVLWSSLSVPKCYFGWKWGGKCNYLKIFQNIPSFASGLGFLMNAENLAKMSMPAVFDSGCLAASLMYLQTGLTHEYKKKKRPAFIISTMVFSIDRQ